LRADDSVPAAPIGPWTSPVDIISAILPPTDTLLRGYWFGFIDIARCGTRTSIGSGAGQSGDRYDSTTKTLTLKGRQATTYLLGLSF